MKLIIKIYFIKNNRLKIKIKTHTKILIKILYKIFHNFILYHLFVKTEKKEKDLINHYYLVKAQNINNTNVNPL